MKSLLATLWEKISTRQKQKKLEYKFLNLPEEDSTMIEITGGKYSGVVFSYGHVRFEEGELGQLQFTYNVQNPGQHGLTSLLTDREYHTMMGDILTDIIINQESHNEQTRTLDSKESDLQ
jgi:hypothetical protein